MPRFYHATFIYIQSNFMALASEETTLFFLENQKSCVPDASFVPSNNRV